MGMSVSLAFFFLCLRRARQKKEALFSFFCGLNLEQMLSPAYRKCGRSTALFFFFWGVSEPGTGASLQKIVESGSHFSFFLVSEPGTDARPSLTENVERDRGCWLPLIDGNERLAGLFFSVLAQGKAKKRSTFLFFLRSEPGTDAEPSLQKMWKVDRTFLFFLGCVWTWNRC